LLPLQQSHPGQRFQRAAGRGAADAEAFGDAHLGQREPVRQAALDDVALKHLGRLLVQARGKSGRIGAFRHCAIIRAVATVCKGHFGEET